jgi:branched-chain amino acid transport system ATP-binding protein
MEKKPLLEVTKLEVVYQSAIVAVQGVSLSVPEHSIIALLGVNGAGKSTTLRAISGFLGIDDAEVIDGTIEFMGEILNNKKPHVISRKGVALVPEREKIFVTLTVRENLESCLATQKGGGKDQMDMVHQFFPVLHQRRNQVAGYLSGGERQMLALSMALLCAPKLLLVDELSLGLAPIVVEHLMERLLTLNRETGLTILVVEQNAAAALSIAEFGYIMENGHVVFSGTSDKLLNHEDVKEFYLGLSEQGVKSYRDVKQYRRTRRWWG